LRGANEAVDFETIKPESPKLIGLRWIMSVRCLFNRLGLELTKPAKRWQRFVFKEKRTIPRKSVNL